MLLLDASVLPKSVLDICKAAADAHPEDSRAALDEALSAVMGMSDFEDFVAVFTRMAVRCVVAEYRHRANVAIKKARGDYGGPAKVKVLESTHLCEIYRSVYAYRVAGTVLGDVLVKDIPRLKGSEQRKENGHKFNRLLFAWIEGRIVGTYGGTPIRNAIPETELDEAFRRIMAEVKNPGM